MSESQKCPLCGNEVYYEHAETSYVCKTYCCPYTADIILHFKVVDVLAARDAEVAKLRGLLERVTANKAFNDWTSIYRDIRAALAEGGGE